MASKKILSSRLHLRLHRLRRPRLEVDRLGLPEKYREGQDMHQVGTILV